MGSSTGGPQALLKILADLPANYALPVVCVQHISTGFLPGFVAWLNDNAQLPVVVAEAGMRPHGGRVYVAPEGHHLVVDAQKRFQLLKPSAHELQGPSVDRLFQYLAAVYPGACVGLVLSGMGHDGALGVVAISQQGGLTLAQDEASSIIFGMPKSAIDTGAVAEIWPLSSLAWRLVQLQNLTTNSPPP